MKPIIQNQIFRTVGQGTKSTMTLPGFIAMTASLVISNGEGLRQGMALSEKNEWGYVAGVS
jgi:hypothetical protein